MSPGPSATARASGLSAILGLEESYVHTCRLRNSLRGYGRDREAHSRQTSAAGLPAEARPVSAARDLARYEAFVVGSAAYFGSWLNEAVQFVRRNRSILATRPVWLFSSGPLGTATSDGKGQDVLVASEPKEFAEFKDTINPRGLKVFFGAFDRGKLHLRDRLIASLPAGKELFVEGDFRDWPAIEAWAESIAHELAPVTAMAG